MRHQKKRHRLGRSSSHRRATLAALSNSLIQHKRIVTTEAKAKALRVFVEPLISRSREDTTHNRRQVFRYLQDKHAVTELFSEIAEKVGDRPGGYTRVVKLGQRHGDAAPMAVIEFVDYNDVKPEGAGGRRKRTRRGGGGGRGSGRGKKVAAAAPAVVEELADAADEAAEPVEATAEEAAEPTPDAVDTEGTGAEVEAVSEVETGGEEAVAEVSPDDEPESASGEPEEDGDDAEQEEDGKK